MHSLYLITHLCFCLHQCDIQYMKSVSKKRQREGFPFRSQISTWSFKLKSAALPSVSFNLLSSLCSAGPDTCIFSQLRGPEKEQHFNVEKKKKAESWNEAQQFPSPALFSFSYPLHICCTHVNPCGSERRGPFPSLHSPPLFPLPELTVGTIKTLKKKRGGGGGKKKKAEE